MQLGMIGLGRMGGNIVRRLMNNGHTAVVYDKDSKAVAGLAGEGATGADTLEDFVAKLEKPRTAWVMLPAGKITEATIEALAKLMQPSDVIIDGGNTFWQDDVRRGAALKAKGLHYLDVGTSGGVWGIERGYCMMIGGDKAVVDRLDPIFKTLAPGIGDIPRTSGREGRDPLNRVVHCLGPLLERCRRVDARHVVPIPSAGRVELVRHHALQELPAVRLVPDGWVHLHPRDAPVARHPEADAVGALRIEFEFVGDVAGDGFALAVGVAGEEHLAGLGGLALQFVEDVLRSAAFAARAT